MDPVDITSLMNQPQTEGVTNEYTVHYMPWEMRCENPAGHECSVNVCIID